MALEDSVRTDLLRIVRLIYDTMREIGDEDPEGVILLKKELEDVKKELLRLRT